MNEEIVEVLKEILEIYDVFLDREYEDVNGDMFKTIPLHLADDAKLTDFGKKTKNLMLKIIKIIDNQK